MTDKSSNEDDAMIGTALVVISIVLIFSIICVAYIVKE